MNFVSSRFYFKWLLRPKMEFKPSQNFTKWFVLHWYSYWTKTIWVKYVIFNPAIHKCQVQKLCSKLLVWWLFGHFNTQTDGDLFMALMDLRTVKISTSDFQKKKENLILNYTGKNIVVFLSMLNYFILIQNLIQLYLRLSSETFLKILSLC